MTSAVSARAASSTPSASGWSCSSRDSTSGTGTPGGDPLAGVGEQRPQAVALGVGPLRQSAEVDVERLARRHERSERRPAERGVRVALAGGALDVLDEPGVRGQGRLVGDAGRQPAHARQRPGCDVGRHLVERGQRGVDRVGPGGEVLRACPLALGSRRVLAVVAGQVERAHVQQRVTPVQLDLAERDPGGGLEGRQQPLVVGVVHRWSAQGCEAAGHAGGGQVGHGPVVLVPAGPLPDVGDGQVAQGAQARLHPASLSGAGPAAPAGGPGGPPTGAPSSCGN
jgi:hypothetical protein